MSGLTVGTLIAVLQLRAEQFVAANREAQAGLKATAVEAQATGTATERTEAAIAGLGVTTRTAAAGLRDSTGAYIGAAAGADKLTIAHERLRTAQLQVVAAQERYDAVVASGTATTGELAAAEARLAAAQTRVAAASNEASAALARSSAAAESAAVTTAAAAAKQQASATGAVASVSSTVAKTGALLGGVALALSVADIAKNGNEFTHAMNTLGAASGAAAPQLEAARQQAIAMGKDLTIPKVTATDAATAMEDLVKAGVSLDRAMSAARPALLLAAAANVSVADSARVTGDLLDEWGFSADKATHVANVMATAANSAGGGLMDLFGAMKYVGPSARQLGVGFDYTTAALVELAKAGIQGSMAGTSLRNMLTRLSPQGAPATAALNDLGVAAFDATGKFKGLPTVVDQLHAAAERLSPQAFAADVSAAFGARALGAVQIFAHGGTAALQGFYNKLEAGDVQKFADKMNQGLGAGFSQLGKEFSAVGLDIYNATQGPISSAVHWIGEELPKAFAAGKSVLTEIGHDAQALTPVWSAVSSAFRGSVTVIRDVLEFLGDHTGTLRVFGEAAAGAWLAMKGYSVVTAAAAAIRTWAASVAASATTARTAVQQYATNFAGLMTGTGVVAASSASAVEVAEAEKVAAMARAAAASADAAAVQAESFAGVSASAAESAVAMRAAATQAQATAATMTAAAEEAAAGVTTAGEIASVGWRAMLGPVGVVAAALSFVALGFHKSGDAAKSSAGDIDAFTEAIKADNGVLAQHSALQAQKKLADEGAFTALQKLNSGLGANVLSQQQLTDAALGNAGAQKSVSDAVNRLQTALNDGSGFDNSKYGTVELWNATTDLSSALSAVQGNISQGQQGYTDYVAAQGAAAVAAAATSANLDELKKELGAASVATDAASLASARGLVAASAFNTGLAAMQAALGGNETAAQGLSDTLNALNGTLSQRQAQDSFLDAQAQLKTALDASSGSLDQNNDKGRAADQAFTGAIKSAQDYAVATAQVTDSIPASIDAYNQSIEALFATAQQSGATSAELDVLRQSVDSVPDLKKIFTEVVGDQQATSQLNALQQAIDALHDKTITVKVLQNTAIGAIAGTAGTAGASTPPYLVPSASSGSGHVTGGHAGGGLINAPGNGQRDTVLSPVANREFIMKAAAVNKVGVPFFAATNRGDLDTAAAILRQRGYDGAAAAPMPVQRTVQITNHLTGWERREVAAYNAQQIGPAF